MKKHANSNISTNQCNFLANKAVSLLVCFPLIYTSRLKENFTIVYFPLKNMSLQIQDVKSFNNFFEERWYLRNDNLFLNLPDIKVYFFWTESIVRKTFLRKTINIANNYLHHSKAVLDKQNFRFINPTSFPEKYTQNITFALSYAITFYVYYSINHIPLEFVIMLPFIPKSF